MRIGQQTSPMRWKEINSDVVGVKVLADLHGVLGTPTEQKRVVGFACSTIVIGSQHE